MTHADTQVDSSAACTAIDSFRQPCRANRFSALSAEGVLPVRRRLTLVGGRFLAAADTRQTEQHDLTRHDSLRASTRVQVTMMLMLGRMRLSGPGVLVWRTSRSMSCHSLFEMPRGRGVSVGVQFGFAFHFRVPGTRDAVDPSHHEGSIPICHESCSAGGGSGEVGRF